LAICPVAGSWENEILRKVIAVVRTCRRVTQTFCEKVARAGAPPRGRVVCKNPRAAQSARRADRRRRDRTSPWPRRILEGRRACSLLHCGGTLPPPRPHCRTRQIPPSRKGTVDVARQRNRAVVRGLHPARRAQRVAETVQADHSDSRCRAGWKHELRISKAICRGRQGLDPNWPSRREFTLATKNRILGRR